MINKGIISKDRVKQFGEVFTPDSIVCGMIDLVEKRWGNISDEEYISKTYIEPACGDGQFLIRLLSRKLERVAKLPIEEREITLIKAVSSIYGVDIQDDNVKNSIKRMLSIIEGKEVTTFDLDGNNTIQIDLGISANSRLKSAVESILNANIVVGNTLETVNLYEYRFKGNNVRVRKFEVGHLADDLYPWKEYVHYSEIASILKEEEPETFNW